MNSAVVVRMVLGVGCVLAVACAADEPKAVTPPPPTAPSPPPTRAPAPPPAFPTACPAPAAPKTPVDYGVCVLDAARARAKSDATVTVVLASNPATAGISVADAPESYAITSRGDQTWVVGRDAVGAMYGALDLAERLDEAGAAAIPIATPIQASPLLRLRAANLMMVLPEPGQASWWFREPSFWTQYLDMMARARMDFLDIHGMYDLESTLFPNPLLYFATSASLPTVGIPRAEREANLAMLNEVVAMAKVRGIQVGLMGYRADLSLLGNEPETDAERAQAFVYTREAVRDLATRVPGLEYIGFRVGESKRDPAWYSQTYLAGLKDAGSHAHPYSRTWLTTKEALMPIVAAGGPETILEVKYNGEHLGPPYVVSGGGMEKRGTYSYKDLLDPPTPYRFVFQVRAGGTHRIFRYASYVRTKRAVLSMTMSPRVYGFTLEAAHAYLPQRDFYHASPADSFSPYAFRRDELSYLLFGRLGYDPSTPEHVFRAMLRERVGTDALWAPVQAASDIVPLLFAQHTCGVDQRNYAPELELGGSVRFWSSPHDAPGQNPFCGKAHETLDEFAIALPYEAASDLLAKRGTSRLSPIDVAVTLLADAKGARAARDVTVDPGNVEARDVVRECAALADLGDWAGHKLRAATALAVYAGSGDARWLAASRAEASTSDAAFRTLATDTAYIQPFEERLRMVRQGFPLFHWKEELPRLAEDPASIDEVANGPRIVSRASGPLPEPTKWLTTPRQDGPGLARLAVTPENADATSWTVTATFAAPVPRGAAVNILHRPFRSNAEDWSPVPATGRGAAWSAKVPGTGAGGMFAVEVNAGPGRAWRYPDVTRETPYKAIAP